MKIKVGDFVKVKNLSHLKNKLFEVLSITRDGKGAEVKNKELNLYYIFPITWLEVCKNARNS